MKKILLTLLCLLQLNLIFAANAKYESENYNLNLTYNDVITPGDAIFVRLNITIPKTHKKSKNEPEKKATLQLLQDKKVIESAPFYQLKKKTASTEMLCGIPVSLWLKDGNYSLKIIYADSDTDIKEFILPSRLQMRTFPEEVLQLDERNTNIKTDNSPERAAQIEKLNNILFTSMPSDIFSLKKFTRPTESQRYTAYCGDRRTYVYTNGKSSTSLHYGNDYGVPTGTEVKACAGGKVVMAESRISTGWSVVIEHLPGLYSLYYHMSELSVKEGDMVNQGQLIGKSGATGLATGPHLHWEVRLNGSAVRPEFFLSDFTFEEN
ncbi:M23 family metallopeptidase [Treponema bryantii]|uniref:M23 family metallopeptidase n=1 Tax=Treponema bryantii TaxID=163 RepID=UPI0003B57D0A|nr:M23 family metallopeptidase [Treponema bryantii]